MVTLLGEVALGLRVFWRSNLRVANSPHVRRARVRARARQTSTLRFSFKNNLETISSWYWVLSRKRYHRLPLPF